MKEATWRRQRDEWEGVGWQSGEEKRERAKQEDRNGGVVEQ